jgi:hypothetical protein
MVRFVIGGDEVSCRQEVVAGEVVVCRNVGACRRGVDGCGVTDPVGEPFRRCCCVEGRVASCRGARGPASLRSRST